jgi:hypothetical protein
VGGYRNVVASAGAGLVTNLQGSNPKSTPIHELKRHMRCKDCSQLRSYPYKRSSLITLRPNKISADDPKSDWWPEER